MTLISNWKQILVRAWSVRLILLAGIFTVLEAVVPLFQDRLPPSIFAIMSGLTALAALLARIIAQPSLQKKEGQ